MPRSRARRLNLNNDDLDLVENAKWAAARDDFAVYRRVIRREMLWDWWPQEVSEKLQQFYTRPESRATAQGGDHGPAGVGAPAGNVQPLAGWPLHAGCCQPAGQADWRADRLRLAGACAHAAAGGSYAFSEGGPRYQGGSGLA